MKKTIRMLSVVLMLALLVSVFPTAAQADVTVFYTKDFGSNPYTGTNPGEGEDYAPFEIPESVGTDFSLEAVINIQDIMKASGRGLKLIVRSCPLASNGVMEVWIGANDIWACTNGWKGNGIVSGFNSEPYWGKDLTVRLDIYDEMVDLYLDGTLIWSWSDPSFSAGGETTVTLSGWDAKYTIKSVKVTTVPEKEAPAEEHLDPVPEMGGTKYYVDSAAADGGDGLTPETAWNSIAQVNAHAQFLPDDQILFKRSSEFIGTTLTPKGYGIEGHPIIIDSYGEGPLPILDRQGDMAHNGSSTLILSNQSWWTIRNIQISNHNPVNPGTLEDIVVSNNYATFPIRHGLMVEASYVNNAYKKIVRGIVVENVLFEGIDTSHGDEGNCWKYRIDSNISASSGGGALGFRATDQQNGDFRAHIDGITVENCTFHNIGGTAIGAQSGWKYQDSFSNVAVRNNRIYNDPDLPISCTGMYFVSCESPLLEYNSIQNMTNGIGFQICTNPTAQYNTVVNVDGYLELCSRYTGVPQYWDGCGIDADTRCTGSIVFRGNYLENCREGSFAFFDYGETDKALVTLDGNISYNCGSFLYYQCDNASYDFLVQNNTAIRLPGGAEKMESAVIHIYNGSLDNNSISFKDNIFYYPNQIVLLEYGSSVYSGNLLEGVSGEINDSGKLTGDPLLVLPTAPSLDISYNGSVPGTTSLLSSGLFQFQADSPCVKDGDVICGANMGIVKAEEPDATPAPTDPAPTLPGTAQEPGQSPDTLVIVGIVVAVIAAAVVVILIIKSKKK